MRLIIIFLYIVLIIFLFTKSVIGKYLNNQEIIADTQIAIPVFIVEGENSIKIDRNSLNKGYNFYIKNYEEEKINDVDFEYTIYFESNIQDKVILNLEKDGNNLIINNNKTEKIIMKSGEKVEHLYHLKIERKENVNEVIGTLNIKVLANQMK